MSTAEARASQEAVESATMDALVSNGLLPRERLISLGIMQEVEDMAELIDRGEISLQILAEAGFEIDAAEAAEKLAAEEQEMLVTARIIRDPENLPLEYNDVLGAVDMERELTAIALAAEARRTTEQDERAEDLKRLSRVYVPVLMNADLLTNGWLMQAGIIQRGETRTLLELIKADVITLNVLREKGFKITVEELGSLGLGETGKKILILMNLVEKTTTARLTDESDPETSH